MSRAAPQPPESRRIAFLDTLRLIAASAVLFQHVFERHQDSVVRPLIDFGPGVMGVVLFFMISGFVIPLSVVKGFDVRAFAISRIFRIYPLFLVAFPAALLAGYTGWLPRFDFVRDLRPFELIANLLLVQDFVGARTLLGVSWTLIIELIWYAIFAITFLLAGRRAGDWLSIAAPFLLLAMAGMSLAIGHRIPLGRPDMIYAAVVGYQAYRHMIGDISGRRFWAGAALFLAVGTICNVVAFGHFRHPTITVEEAVGPWWLATAIFLGVYGSRRIRTSGIFNTPILAHLGAISYSLYLLHPFAVAFGEAYAPPAFRIAIDLLLPLPLAMLGYRFIERPGIRLGRWLIARRARRITLLPEAI